MGVFPAGAAGQGQQQVACRCRWAAALVCLCWAPATLSARHLHQRLPELRRVIYTLHGSVPLGMYRGGRNWFLALWLHRICRAAWAPTPAGEQTNLYNSLIPPHSPPPPPPFRPPFKDVTSFGVPQLSECNVALGPQRPYGGRSTY